MGVMPRGAKPLNKNAMFIEQEGDIAVIYYHNDEETFERYLKVKPGDVLIVIRK
jgi:hypothetical protein